MSTIDLMVESYRFYRARTVALLERVRQEPDPQAVLAWRPGSGRAHVAWQLMHIAMTEELFATERLAPDRPGEFLDLRPRFRGGSSPDEQIPTLEEIGDVLATTRARLLETLGRFHDGELDEFKFTNRENRRLTLREVLFLIGWHEAHHQGQAHLTLNLYRAAQD